MGNFNYKLTDFVLIGHLTLRMYKLNSLNEFLSEKYFCSILAVQEALQIELDIFLFFEKLAV